MERIYFQGLNGIRAIAAIIVLVFHIDLYMPLFKIKSIGFSHGGMAVYGVILFFVLSGYLITYLLLTEKDKYERINIKYFYLRRVLRIWPLYYLAIIIAVILIFLGVEGVKFHDQGVGLAFTLYSFFLSNVGYVLGCGILSIAALWSVGVEEQFYLFWPWLVEKSKKLYLTLISLIVIYNVLKFLLRYSKYDTLYSIVSHTSIDCMAIGGLASYTYFVNKKALLSIFYNNYIQFISWLFLIISIVWKPIYFWSMINYEIHAIVYAIIILNVSTNPKSLVNLENTVLNFFGRISYGIYVYHLIIISILSFFASKMNFENANPILTAISVYILIIGLTTLIAYISYYYYENIFLRKKTAFSKIHSNDQ